MLQHENMQWRIVDNPNVVGERIRIATRSNKEHSEPNEQSRVVPGTIPFPAPPNSVPANLRE